MSASGVKIGMRIRKLQLAMIVCGAGAAGWGATFRVNLYSEAITMPVAKGAIRAYAFAEINNIDNTISHTYRRRVMAKIFRSIYPITACV